MIAVTTLEQPGRVERYEPFFGLNKAPFSLAPDTRFLFASASHSAALAQVARVRIVHGHGMGVLKKAVADLLGKSPHVEKFYLAPPREGGAGATIVELKA